jgi:hypothetical protein
MTANRKYLIHNKCSICKKEKSEVKVAIERGSTQISHEERLKRIKDARLLTVIETKT